MLQENCDKPALGGWYVGFLERVALGQEEDHVFLAGAQIFDNELSNLFFALSSTWGTLVESEYSLVGKNMYDDIY